MAARRACGARSRRCWPRRPGGRLGLRGADDGPRIYTAAGLTIAEVAWAARRQRGTITALLSAADETTPFAGRAATLYDADNMHIATTAVDDVGTFGYDAVAAGMYRVELAQGDRAVSIEGIYVVPRRTRVTRS